MRTQQLKIYGTRQKQSYKGNSQPLQAYFKKQEKAQVNNLTLYLKELEKDNKPNPN